MEKINVPQTNPNQSKNPNEEWTNGIVPKDTETREVFVSRKGDKPYIPVSDTWSHRYETKTSRPETPYGKCFEGEVHQAHEPLMGLASFFLLVQPDESKIKVVGWILLAIFLFSISIYYYFRFMKIIERRKSKKVGIKLAVEKNKEQEEKDQEIGYC